MISTIRTAVILILLIDFLQLLAGGKEYERFVKLVTGLLIACSLVAGVLELTGRLSEETWSLWLSGEMNGLEELVVENGGLIMDSEPDPEKNTEKHTGTVEIEVPLVEEIPEIVVEEIKAGGER